MPTNLPALPRNEIADVALKDFEGDIALAAKELGIKQELVVSAILKHSSLKGIEQATQKRATVGILSALPQLEKLAGAGNINAVNTLLKVANPGSSFVINMAFMNGGGSQGKKPVEMQIREEEWAITEQGEYVHLPTIKAMEREKGSEKRHQQCLQGCLLAKK